MYDEQRDGHGLQNPNSFSQSDEVEGFAAEFDASYVLGRLSDEQRHGHDLKNPNSLSQSDEVECFTVEPDASYVVRSPNLLLQSDEVDLSMVEPDANYVMQNPNSYSPCQPADRSVRHEQRDIDTFGGLNGAATVSNLGLRRLVAWLQRITHTAAKLGVAGRAWTCSTAFSGIGYAEIAAMALTRRRTFLRFLFECAVEKDPACRSIIANHSPGSRCTGDILDWLPSSVDLRRFAHPGHQ